MRRWIYGLSCLGLLLAVAQTPSRAGQALRVPEDFGTIQEAANHATAGDTIHVSAGTYHEDVYLPEGVSLVGASAQNTAIIAVHGDAAVVIVGSRSGPRLPSSITDLTLSHPANGTWGPGCGLRVESASPIVRRCHFGPSWNNGIQLANGADADIRDCTFQHCGTDISHPAILIFKSSPVVVRNQFLHNKLGIYVTDVGSAPHIEANLFEGNLAAAIYIEGNSGSMYMAGLYWPLILNNLVIRNGGAPHSNWVQPRGGIITGGTAIITGNTVVDNIGTGIARFPGYSPLAAEAHNNICVGNSVAGVSCSGAYLATGHNDVWGNSVDWAGCAPSGTDLSVDPHFRDPGAGDYAVADLSACIDSGDASAPGVTSFDYNGDPRVRDGDGDGVARVDIGAVEVELLNRAPTAHAGGDVVLECVGPAGTAWTLQGQASMDPDGDALAFLWSASGVSFDDATAMNPAATFPVGETLVTLTVTDGKGGFAIDDVRVTVVDTSSPAVACTTTLSALWPPNHELVPVKIVVQAGDACTAPDSLDVTCTVSSSEPDDATGDGAFDGDVNGQDGHAKPVAVTLSWSEAAGAWIGLVDLRAERNGEQAGRTYSIACRVEDASGNASAASCVVVVPHDKRRR